MHPSTWRMTRCLPLARRWWTGRTAWCGISGWTWPRSPPPARTARRWWASCSAAARTCPTPPRAPARASSPC
eukprot:4188239-Pyramimonas_sp.AAC.1